MNRIWPSSVSSEKAAGSPLDNGHTNPSGLRWHHRQVPPDNVRPTPQITSDLLVQLRVEQVGRTICRNIGQTDRGG